MKSEKRDVVCFAVLATAIGLLWYFPFLHNFFDYDDFKYLENFHVSPLSVLLGYGNLRVISNLAWWPLFAISGNDPFLYNLFSVLLHAANGTLVYLLIRRLLQNAFLAAVCGGFFLVCSVACDALLWKAASNTLIAAFFYLTTLYLYIRYRQTGSRRWFYGSISVFVLAIFSKEDAASMPFILILLEGLYFDGFKEPKKIAARVAPFAAAIIVYIVAGKIVFDVMLHVPVEHAKFFQIRPLYSILACWTVFFLPHDGHVAANSPGIFLTLTGIVVALLWVKDRRIMLLGLGWIFFSFLPQSFTSLGQLDPKYYFDSISRYLYLPSIGSSIVLGAVLLRVREALPKKVSAVVIAVLVSLLLVHNYRNVQARGWLWQADAEPMARFLKAMKQSMPVLPRNSYIYVVNAEPGGGYVPGKLAGRAYVQQGLRAFYANPSITWLVDPSTYANYPREYLYFVICYWRPDGDVDLEFQ